MRNVPIARLPPPVLPGDKVGVAALSGPADPVRLEAGLAALRDLGFEPVVAANAFDRSGLFAGNDGHRLESFHQLLRNPEIKAVFFVRGGYGLMRLLPRIDWDLLGSEPRAFIGYSDLTPLLWQIVERFGWVTFHGPMVAADLARGLTKMERISLLDALAGRGPFLVPLASAGGEPAEEMTEGPLVGGCLSMLTALLGTPYFPSLRGRILFWEDIDEPLYRLDRMLTHLRLSGSLSDLRAMVIGHLTCSDGSASERWRCRLEEAVKGFPWPVFWGLECGHQAPNRTLPMGLQARLEMAAGRMELFEA
ncbi:MAG: LD-carboxypeptidase [Acidobacteriota bacterium]